MNTQLRCVQFGCGNPTEHHSNFCREHMPRRVRAGTAPPPSSPRAEHRAACSHGPYSYGHPGPDTLPPVTDSLRERLARQQAERKLPVAIRLRYITALGLVTALGAYSLLARFFLS